MPSPQRADAVARVAAKRQVLHGNNRNQLIVLRCRVCGKWVALRVDPDDLAAHNNGVFIQNAMPYLAPELRELLISSTCPDCWAVLCPSDPLAYS